MVLLQRFTFKLRLRVLFRATIAWFNDVNIIFINCVVLHCERLLRGRFIENPNATALGHHFLQVVGLIVGESLEQLRLVILKPLLHGDRLTIHSLGQVVEHLLLHILSVFYSVKQLRLDGLQLPDLVFAAFYFALLSTQFVQIVYLRKVDFPVPMSVE